MNLPIFAPLVGGLLALATAPGPVPEGLILHLDAASQVQAAGRKGNSTWRNLAGKLEHGAGSAVLHNFPFDKTAGWVGSGQPGDPFALRFDGKRAYAEGPGNLEIGEITIEVWGRATGVSGPHGMRGATLLGTDYGKGGIGLLIAASGTPLLLHGATHTPLAADTPLGQWTQVVVALKNGAARFYVNGRLECAVPTPRALQPDHPPIYQLGTARFQEMDYVACDGLIGEIAIVRVYERTLKPEEVRRNFLADCQRIGVASPELSTEPVCSVPIVSVPGLDPAPSARCAKWDYMSDPPGITATEAPGASGRYAFDGYPTRMSEPYASTYWRSPSLTPDKPAYVVIDYKRPVPVTRFVHYFERGRIPAAWKDVDVLISDDLEQWTLLSTLTDLPPECPQVIAIDQPRAARFYKLVVHRLGSGAVAVATHEIETYYGATVGSVTVPTGPPVQSEPCKVRVHVVSPDVALQGAVLRLVVPDGSIQGEREIAAPAVARGSSATAEIAITPLHAGPIPALVELHAGGHLIDRRPYTLRVRPKLVLREVSPAGAVAVAPGQRVTAKGTVVNAGIQPAIGVEVHWMEQSVLLGDLASGTAKAFQIEATARPGFAPGELVATAGGQTRTMICRALICAQPGPSASIRMGRSEWTPTPDGLRTAFRMDGLERPVTAVLRLLASGKPCQFVRCQSQEDRIVFATAVPGGVLRMEIGQRGPSGGDAELRCAVLSEDPDPLDAPWLDLDLRLAVDEPRVLFRPHIDWYTVEHGPNWRPPQNAHNSATRMLSIQTPGATVSMVPDTDNLTWGFTSDYQMTAAFQIPLAPHDPLHQGIWRPIAQAPTEFRIALPVRKGDWWDAFRHVVTDVFHFEEPRQWPMPITQMRDLLETALRQGLPVDNSRRNVCNRGRDPLIGLDGASPHAHDSPTHRQCFCRFLRSIRRRHRDGQGP